MMDQDRKAAHRTDRAAELNALIDKCEQTTTLDTWNAFCNEVKVPSEVLPVLMSGRPELLDALKPRALTAEECAAMYDLLKELIRTNVALRTHAENVSILVKHWAGNFKALATAGRRIEDFAAFQTSASPKEEDEG